MSPAAQLLDKAIAMLRPGDPLALASDAWTYADERSEQCLPAGKRIVLLAIVRPSEAGVLAIPVEQYSGAKVLELAGLADVFGARDEPLDIEQLRREKHELQTRPIRRNLDRPARA